MVVLTDSIFQPLSVLIVRVLKTMPDLPATFMVTGIAPVVPGKTFQGIGGSCATVQPQDDPTWLIETSPEETFVKLKTICATG